MMVDALLCVAGSITGNTVTGQAVNGNGTTVVSGSSIDLGVARDVGEGKPLYARIQVTTSFAGGTSGEFQIITADDAALTTNVTVLGTTGAVAVASLAAGARLAAVVSPRLLSNARRYLGIQCVNVGNNTAGSVFADFGIELQDFKVYAIASTVL